MTDPDFQPSASYLANPEDVHRVLLLYSGGLDTSVMLKWIQDEYQAEVVALTVNLGQPGEDYGVIELNQQADALLNCEKKLTLIPGATHLFEEPGTLQQAAHSAADWFVQHL